MITDLQSVDAINKMTDLEIVNSILDYRKISIKDDLLRHKSALLSAGLGLDGLCVDDIPILQAWVNRLTRILKKSNDS